MSESAIAIDLGGTFIKYGIVSKTGEILWENKIETPFQDRDKIIDQLVACIKEAESHSKSSCIGIGTPGLIDISRGFVIDGAPQLDNWKDLPLADILSKKVKLPVFVDNDANLMGLGEYRFGKNKKLKNLIFLTVGTGIGGAIIIEGALYRGSFYAGGEFGYFPFCRKGKNGYWEDFGSTKAMINLYKHLSDKNDDNNIDGKYVLEKVKEAEKAAIAAFEEHIDILGQGIAGFISVLNPEKVIIGGGISESGEDYIESIRQKVSVHAAEECYSGVEIEAAILGNKAGFLGAGHFALSLHAASMAK